MESDEKEESQRATVKIPSPFLMVLSSKTSPLMEILQTLYKEILGFLGVNGITVSYCVNGLGCGIVSNATLSGVCSPLTDGKGHLEPSGGKGIITS